MRLAELEIDPAQVDSYKAALKEEIEASIRLEPGVLDPLRCIGQRSSERNPDLRDVRGRSCLRSTPPDSSFQKVQNRNAAHGQVPHANRDRSHSARCEDQVSSYARFDR